MHAFAQDGFGLAAGLGVAEEIGEMGFHGPDYTEPARAL